MEGLPTFYGNPVSSHADQYLDLVGYGKLLGLSPRRELNTMATMRYRLEFGEPNVYSLPWQSEKEEKHDVAAHHRGATLFGPDMTYARLPACSVRARHPQDTDHRGVDFRPIWRWRTGRSGRCRVDSKD